MSANKMLEQSIDSKNNMSEKILINNVTNNLNESNSHSKMKISTLSNLLKSIKKEENDSDNDSGHSSDASSTSGDNFDNLIALMTSFDINKDPNKDVKRNSDANKNKSNTNDPNKKRIDLVKNDFDTIIQKDDTKQSKMPSTKKIHIKLKKSSKSKIKEKEDGECVSKVSANSDETNKNVNRLCEELSSVTISKDKHTQSEKKLTKDKKKPEDSNATNKKSKNKDPIFIERGPIVDKTLSYVRKEKHPYENKQIYNHRRSLSGGKLLLKESLDVSNSSPITINNNIEVRLQPPQNNETIDTCDNLTNIQQVLDDLYDTMKKDMSSTCKESTVINGEIECIISYLKSGNTNFELPDITNPNNFFIMSPNPNPNLQYITGNSENNQYRYQYSPDRGIMSPPEFTDNFHLYGPMSNESSLSTTKESNESFSSNGSPTLQETEETSISFSNQSAESVIANSIYSSSSEVQDFNLNSNSCTYPQMNSSNVIQSPNDYSGTNAFVTGETNNLCGVTLVPLMENSPQNHTIHITDNYRHNNQLIMSDISTNILKINVPRPVPIAPKEKWRCCTDFKISASETMLQIFNRLDVNTQIKICNKVHTINEVELLNIFDYQLSNWNKFGSQFPRLEHLQVTCERLLMQSQTMEKFLEIYSNKDRRQPLECLKNHTVLDRVFFTCWQTPIVAKYVAECMIKAINCTNSKLSLLDNNKLDNSGSTILHMAADRGEKYAMTLASLLSLNDQFGPPIFNVNKYNNNGCTPLHLACKRHLHLPLEPSCPCLMTAHVLLEHGYADPNLKDNLSGNTALHFAVSSSSHAICAPKLVTLLLKHGAQLSVRNYKGNTPLELAKVINKSSNDPHMKQAIDILKKTK